METTSTMRKIISEYITTLDEVQKILTQQKKNIKIQEDKIQQCQANIEIHENKLRRYQEIIKIQQEIAHYKTIIGKYNDKVPGIEAPNREKDGDKI
jgi:multidrug resistance efflux pump